MNKSTITRERAQQIFLGNGPEPSASEERELARMALAAMDSEPVAYTEKHEISNMHATGLYLRAWPADRERNAVEGYTIPLYRHAQPALVVPDEIKHRIGGLDWGWEGEFNRGWNACRAAMLQAEPVCTCPSGDGSLRWPCPVHPGSSPVIPDGYVMVPKEPTAEMVKKMRYHVGGYDRNIKDGYKAMLAAAPQEVKGE
ncbi:hypothetical protein [Klebsiella pneumoniae]|uniref:Eaa protein n=1 Tax=Klebsiella pneumoniae TaxID=573 RepID=A0A485RV82_KLEPN|nr:hypothetical protein [Klebsiella pneumoniae]EKJ7697687.1 hypothetical protein [Klebsiella pneumoniae]MCV6944877.1 hypothetical protein [Klebsiella pneumoniae]VFZ94308.1 Uncharacterised protein [Klebsiella pneumoniae]VGK09821.1 Uncharacterised protein [Klebsiella pneumoniae]VGK44430.1 Uncharacterised protein [Klebsiella pneumoniae]